MDFQKRLDLARDWARRCHEEELSVLRLFAAMPSPSGHEEARARLVQEWLIDQGATSVQVDDAHNVICRIGDPTGRTVVFSAHTDIVFPDLNLLPLHEDARKLYAPGVGDDTANLVNLLMATTFLLRHPNLVPPRTQVVMVANSCEEGLGNLRGTKALYARNDLRIARHVAFDLYLPQCITQAVGSHRFRIRCITPGGHSLRDFGTPNAIEVLCGIVEGLYGLNLPAGATVNVGAIKGGTKVNAIAARASMVIEYRSPSNDDLLHLYGCVKQLVDARRAPDVKLEVEKLGVRPGNGSVNQDQLDRLSSICQHVITAATGQQPDLSPASTDANVPLSLGIPAACVGTVLGGLLHTRNELIDKGSLENGLTVALALMLGADEL